MSPDVLALLALGESVASEAGQAHLDSCAECRAELAGLARVVDSGRRAEPGDGLLNPPPAVWSGIRAELGLDPKLAAVSVVDSAAASEWTPSIGAGTPRPRRYLPFVLAACLALVAGVGIGLGVPKLTKPRETVVSQADLSARPGWDGASGRAVVERDSAGNRTLVVTVESARPADAARQVWLIERQQKGMSSMGYLSNGRGSFTIPDRMNLDEFAIVDVSAEPGDDANPLHSGDSIVRGTLTPA